MGCTQGADLAVPVRRSYWCSPLSVKAAMPSDWPPPSGRSRLRVSAERHHSAAAPGGGRRDVYWSARPPITSAPCSHWWRQPGGGAFLPAAAAAGGTRAALGAGFGAPRVRGAATRRARCPGEEPGEEPGKERSGPAFKRDVLADPRPNSSVQDSTLGIRTWDSSCQIPDGSSQLTSWLTTVKRIFGLFYSIFVGDHNPQTLGRIRFHISCRILK